MQFHQVILAALVLESVSALATRKDDIVSHTQVSKCDTNAEVNPPAAVASINNNDGIGSGNFNYTDYSGDSTHGDGWPGQSQFNNNKNSMFSSCAQYGVADGSGPEVGSIYNDIQQIAQKSGVDHRFILAVTMEESNGCVRIPTSIAPDANPSIYDPGLTQPYGCCYTCNTSERDEYNEHLCVVIHALEMSNLVLNSNMYPVVLKHHLTDTIRHTIQEGAVSIDSGDGVATLLKVNQSQGATDAQTFYIATRVRQALETYPPKTQEFF